MSVLLLVLALLVQFVPLAPLGPEPASDRRGATAATFLRALDVCGKGGGDGCRGIEQPLLPAPLATVAAPTQWAFIPGRLSLDLPEGFRRLPLRPPRS